MDFFKNQKIIDSIIRKHLLTSKNKKLKNYNEQIKWNLSKWTLADSKKSFELNNTKFSFSKEALQLFNKSFSHIVPIICDTEQEKENLIMSIFLFSRNANWTYKINNEQVLNLKSVSVFREDGTKAMDLWVNFENSKINIKELNNEIRKRNHKIRAFLDITKTHLPANYVYIILGKLAQRDNNIDLSNKPFNSINQYVANLYHLEKSLESYIISFKNKARAFEDLKNMTDKANELAKSTAFNGSFKKFEIDPGSDFEVVSKLSNEFKEIKPFLISDYNKNLTLRFRKIDNHKAKGIYFSHAENITININNHNYKDTPHITSFFHEYAHHIDAMLGFKVNSIEANKINLRIPFSLSNPDFTKLHKKYNQVFAQQEKLGNVKNFKKSKVNDYLTTHEEVFARGFERYLVHLDFQSSFNKSKNQMDLAAEDVFDYLDIDTKEAFYKIYDDIFEIRKKMKIVAESKQEIQNELHRLSSDNWRPDDFFEGVEFIKDFIPKENLTNKKLEVELIQKELLPELIKIEKNKTLLNEIKEILATKMIENYKTNNLDNSNLPGDLNKDQENLIKQSILKSSNLIDFRKKFMDRKIEDEFWKIVGTKYKEYSDKFQLTNQHKKIKKGDQIPILSYETEKRNYSNKWTMKLG